MRTGAIGLLILGTLAAAPAAQNLDDMARLENDFRVIPNVTYHTASNMDLKVDLYVRRDTSQPQPTLLFFHGGGWIVGAKEARTFAVAPYIAMGLNVVTVQYRLARVAPAPAAVEDCRCALKWVLSHAKEYGIDPQKIVVAGDSAGGHLAMTTAFLPASAGLEHACSRTEHLGPTPVTGDMKVAAVLNWYGISDVRELLDGPNMRTYTVTWLGSALNREEIATRVSPMTYVRAGLPPVLTIHGDADPTVPHQQSVRLHQALSEKGVPNELLTIPGGKHGLACCNLEQRTDAYRTIQTFLGKHGVVSAEVTKAP